MPMKKNYLHPLLCGLVLLGTSAAVHAEPDATAAVAQEVLLQQKVIADNQSKIDTKLAEIAEDLRVARIFVSRAGGRK